jgi:Lon protease-like protein
MVAGTFRKAADLPRVIPIFPLKGAMLLPHAELPLRIFEPRYLNMVDDAMGAERMIGMIQPTPGGEVERPKLTRVGCLGRITSFAETSDDCYLITLTGLCRFNLGEELSVRLPYRQVNARYDAFEADLKPLGDDDGFDRMRFLRALKPYLDRRSLELDWEAAKVAAAEALVNSLSMVLPFEPAEKQALLEAPTPSARREALIALMEIDSIGPAGEDEPTPLQ